MLVFFPLEDVSVAGYIYGWFELDSGLIVVCGILPASLNAAEATRRLRNLSGVGSTASLYSCLEIVGNNAPDAPFLEGNKPSMLPSFDYTPGDLTFVMYKRAEMGFAAIRFSNVSAPASSGVLNVATLTKLNATNRLHKILVPPSTWGPQDTLPRLQTWLSTYLQDFQPSSGQKSTRHSYLVNQVSARFAVLADILSSTDARVLENSGSWANQHRFGNGMWLILNDLVIGIILGRFIVDNSVFLGHALGFVLMRQSVVSISRTLVWLDSWPAGLKLNTELSRFLCKSLLTVTDVWAYFLELLQPYLSLLVRLSGYIAHGGFTLVLALALDFLHLFASPAILSHRALLTVLTFEARTLSSLWNLFRGKRYNILRKQVDNYAYEVDQLLLGTLLFTLLTFSLPTLGVYVALFSLINLLGTFSTTIVRTLLSAMNEFPLFAFLLRMKDPRRLPSSLWLRPTGATLTLEVEHAGIWTLVSKARFMKREAVE